MAFGTSFAGAGAGDARSGREVTLSPELTSASDARRILRAVLREADREEWLDAGELALSEVVTNATLHAHTPIELRIGVYDNEVRVEVRDYNPALPHPRSYEEEATTGRGMLLVAGVATSYGVESLGAAGKVVWFCVGKREVAPDAGALLDSWDVEVAPPAPATHAEEVLLRGMPATLWLSARQQHDAILRELVLYLAEHDDLDADVVSADRARVMVSDAVLAAVEEAQAQGTARRPLPEIYPSPLPAVPPQLDLSITVPTDVGSCFGALQDVLDVAESLAVEGKLFVRPALPEIIAVRDWVCEQVIAQLAGVPAAPWLGTAHERFERDVHDRSGMSPPEWDATTVTASGRAVVAADDANRIIAVSPALAELLGWEPRELVGRRVVALIPPSLREAHVAGFSRHLTTGEAHVLGIPLDLPVLRSDGDEIMCRLLVELAPEPSGRPVYLAWLDPLEPGH